jgi:hypothetical protein
MPEKTRAFRTEFGRFLTKIGHFCAFLHGFARGLVSVISLIEEEMSPIKGEDKENHMAGWGEGLGKTVRSS